MSIVIVQHTKTPSESVERLLNKLGEEPKILHYGKAVDKLTQYQFFKEHGIPHPEWSINVEDANSWLANGSTVFGRRQIKTSGGSGIEILEEPLEESCEDFKVFTKYIKKKREFRVNLFQHKIINIREKVKEAGKEGNSMIRNKANGFTTTHCKPMSEELTSMVKDWAMQASMVSDSDFIGVDIGYNQFKNLVFVLEVNSGPSIEGKSVNDFVEAIQNANI